MPHTLTIAYGLNWFSYLYIQFIQPELVESIASSYFINIVLYLPGADTATPEIVNATGVSGPCPAGSFCPPQTETPEPCPLGTYSSATKLTSASECESCSQGQYCGEVGLTAPSGPCDAGFYCLTGAQSPNNAVEDATGNL